jgi:hypothetical protein
MNTPEIETAELRDLCGEVAVGIMTLDEGSDCGCPNCVEKDRLVKFAARCTLAVLMHEEFLRARTHRPIPKPAA